MKLSTEKRQRLRKLNAKASSDRSADEKAELKSLLDEAADLGDNIIDILNEQDAAPEGQKSTEGDVTAEEVKSIVKGAAIEAVKESGVTSEVIETLKSKLEEQETLKPEDVKNILTDVLGGQPNMAAIKSAIEESVKSHKPSEGVSKEEFESAVADIKKSFNAGRKNVFDAGNGNQGVVEYPIEHRSGNLSVAQKQLFNIMLNATPGLKEHQIEKISNEGIPEEALRQAKAVGSSNLQRLRKALTTGGSNSGAELIAQDLSSELLNRMYLESQVAAEFISAEIDMPTQSFVLPIRTTRPTFVAGSENPGSNPAESSPGTDDVTLTAAKLIGRTNFSYEADEDAIVPVLNMVTNNLASAAADALENAIINGDTAASQDSDASAGDDVTLFDGIRKYALGGSTDRSLCYRRYLD